LLISLASLALQGGKPVDSLHPAPGYAPSGALTPRADAAGCPGPEVSAARFLEPIVVEEDLGVPRRPPLVGFPIPFAKTARVRSLAGFTAVTKDGAPLPTQLEVLSRWGDGPDRCGAPIRWAYAFVLGDARPGMRSYLALEGPRQGQGRGSTFQPAVRVTESASAIVVDTGAARFTLEREPWRGLSRVEVAGKTVLRLPPGEAAGMLVEKDGHLASPTHASATLEVERAGPVLATIAARSAYAFPGAPPTFTVTTRLSFVAGTSSVLIDHTYYNDAVQGPGSSEAQNRVLADRVFLRLPLHVGADEEVVVGAGKRVHRIHAPRAVLSVQQDKRTPERKDPVYAVRLGGQDLEIGSFAQRPFLAVTGSAAYALATIAFMGTRDPQAIRYDPGSGALDIDWQSEALQIGGARGIWSKAVLDFGALKTGAPPDLEARATAAYGWAARPLIGVPRASYLNSTRVLPALPTEPLPAGIRRLSDDLDQLHDNTAGYLDKHRVTGLQLWPDLPRDNCELDGNCTDYFPGGDANYWDWSRPELEEFLLTADPSFLHDFALGEALTMAETISFRLSPGQAAKSAFSGFSPCFGTGADWNGLWREGLNHRTDRCGDYSYNKVHALAYVLTADRRWLDFFDEGAATTLRYYGSSPEKQVETWRELGAGRFAYQRYEQLLDGAEFVRSKDDLRARRYRDAALAYFAFLTSNSMEHGHVCYVLGTGFADPKLRGECSSDQAWMTPILLDWVLRLGRLYDVPAADRWILDWAKKSARLNTVLDAKGLPDVARRAEWKTTYTCRADARGINDATCAKNTQLENQGGFYNGALLAYLANFAFVLAADPGDPLGVCRWLPAAYAETLRAFTPYEANRLVWGKVTGLAYAYSQAVAGAIEVCGHRR
jgi:hypothetical protein